MTHEQELSPSQASASGDLWAFLAYVATLALAVCFAVALFQPPVVHSHGLPHADFESMLQGGDGVSRHGHKLTLAWALGAAQILLFGALIGLGSYRSTSPRGLGLRGMGLPLATGLALYLGAWSLLIIAYRGYLRELPEELVLSLPAPTAAMLYVLWPVPLIFVFIFVLGFRRFVISDEDEAKFHALVAERREREDAGQATEGAG